jgi:hypothetical protein
MMKQVQPPAFEDDHRNSQGESRCSIELGDAPGKNKTPLRSLGTGFQIVSHHDRPGHRRCLGFGLSEKYAYAALAGSGLAATLFGAALAIGICLGF